jgi:lipoprotein-anchoring transpeptidase ErfK/SrfK
MTLAKFTLSLLCLFCVFSVLAVVHTNPDSLNKPIPKKRYTYPGLYIVVKKSVFRLTVYEDTTVVKIYPCGVGTFRGDKQKKDDYKTPEGNFYVRSIEASTTWEHDFKGDGLGPIKGAYGPWFYRLYTGADSTNTGKAWRGIAIHGTHNPDSIGKNVSGGCIRLKNEDVLDLKHYVRVGMPVRIEE